MMGINVQLDADYMLNLERNQREQLVIQILNIIKEARRLMNKGKISKITYSRIGSLISLAPPVNQNKFSIRLYKEKCQFSDKKKKYLRNALNKFALHEEEVKGESK